MNKRLLLASTTLVFLSGLSNSLEFTNNSLAHEPSGGNSHQEMMSGEGMHDHKTMEIPVGQPVPSVDLIVHPDAMRGWNNEQRIEDTEIIQVSAENN